MKIIHFFLHNFINPKFYRYLIIGGISTLINYGVFYALFHVGVNYVLAAGIGYISGLAFGYFLHKSWTFKDIGGHSVAQISRYFSVYIFSLGLQLGTLYLFVEVLGLDPRIANILSMGLAATSNYLGLKFLVFGKNNHEKYPTE